MTPPSRAIWRLTDWHDYEARNRRANVDYQLRPSIVPLLVASIDRFGVGVTCQRFNLAPGALVEWFPELIEHADMTSAKTTGQGPARNPTGSGSVPASRRPRVCWRGGADLLRRCRMIAATFEVAELPERTANRISVSPDGCWLWTRPLNNRGYGCITVGGTSKVAHRFVYELLCGSIPDGLTLDHLCSVRHCVNPSHLEPCSIRENILRAPSSHAARNAAKTHCLRGHEFNDKNTRVNREGWRVCRVCQREAAALRKAAS